MARSVEGSNSGRSQITFGLYILTVSGRRRRVAIIAMARSVEDCEEGCRQGAMPIGLLGDIVRVIA